MVILMLRRQFGTAMGKKGLRRSPGVIVTLGDYDFLGSTVIVDAEWTEFHLECHFDALREILEAVSPGPW